MLILPDVKSIMENSGTALMGLGTGSGEKRTMTAIKQAISSPLLDINIDGARGVLLNIVGGPDLTMSEVDEAATVIKNAVDPEAEIIFGAVIDDKMMDQIKITLIATRFDEGRLRLFRFKKEEKKEILPSTLEEEKKKNYLKLQLI
jgi:cell division protein FtsZ